MLVSFIGLAYPQTWHIAQCCQYLAILGWIITEFFSITAVWTQENAF